MLMRQPGASRRIAEAHESSVEPVVITSSTSRTCRPASRSGRRTAKASSTLPARSRRGLRARLAVLRTRRTLRRSTSAQLRGDPLGDVFRLVIPPPATLKGVQRQRNDHLHVVVESAFTQIPPVPRAHLPGRAPRPAVLEAVDQPPPAARADEEQKARSLTDGDHAPASAHHGVVGLAPVARQRRRGAAQGADRAFAARKRLPADGAAGREQQRRDIADEVIEDRH